MTNSLACGLTDHEARIQAWMPWLFDHPKKAAMQHY
jgi:hypothetical protein